MGDRANFELIDDNGGRIYLYSHWNGYKMPDILQKALIRGKERWDDESYLFRVIFCELIREEGGIDDIAGAGISTYLTDNNHPIISICRNTISVENAKKISFDDFIKESNPIEFLTQYGWK